MGQRQARNINICKLVKHMIIVKMKKGFIVTKLDNSHLSKNLDIQLKIPRHHYEFLKLMAGVYIFADNLIC